MYCQQMYGFLFSVTRLKSARACSWHRHHSGLALESPCLIDSHCTGLATQNAYSAQTWDINAPPPEELGEPYNIAVATNVLHTGTNLAGVHLPLHVTLEFESRAAMHAKVRGFVCMQTPGLLNTTSEIPHKCAQ